MFETTGLKTFAMSAKDLNKAVKFYTDVLGGQITRRVEPTEEQLKAGQVKEVDVRLGLPIYHQGGGSWAVFIEVLNSTDHPVRWVSAALELKDGRRLYLMKQPPGGELPDGNRWEVSFTQ